jgi:hypothetical protein
LTGKRSLRCWIKGALKRKLPKPSACLSRPSGVERRSGVFKLRAQGRDVLRIIRRGTEAEVSTSMAT